MCVGGGGQGTPPRLTTTSHHHISPPRLACTHVVLIPTPTPRAQVKPTILFSVPTLFKKIYDGVHAKIEEESGLKKTLMLKALDAGNQVRCEGVKEQITPFFYTALTPPPTHPPTPQPAHPPTHPQAGEGGRVVARFHGVP